MYSHFEGGDMWDQFLFNVVVVIFKLVVSTAQCDLIQSTKACLLGNVKR